MRVFDRRDGGVTIFPDQGAVLVERPSHHPPPRQWGAR
jgi:hypothetical protein